MVLNGNTKKMNKIKVKYKTPIINKWDPQLRIYKNDSDIKWSGVVHERITGYNTIAHLPNQKEYALWHIKDISKQEKQNEFYNTL